MQKRQSARRRKSGNASGRRVKEATGGFGANTRGKHPKNKLFVGPRQRKQERAKRHRVGGY
jgi:hypothetical protein